MKNTLIALVVIIVLGGGWWYYTAQPTNEIANTVPVVDTATVPDTTVVREFVVSGAKFKFDPATITVKKGETVRIVFNNAEGFHDWVIDEFNARTKQIGEGKSETIEFVADKVGSFEYYCSVGTHRQMGMKGTLTVTE